jgi:ribose transport system permease protein
MLTTRLPRGTGRAAPASRFSFAETSVRFSRLAILLLMCVLLSFLSSAFLTVDNLLNILRQATPIFVLAAGETIVILAGGIDVSMGSCGALAGCIAAVLMSEKEPVLLAIVVGLLVGALFGLMNGLIVTRVRLPPFITTFGTYLLGKGLVVLFIDGKVIYGFPPSFRLLGATRVDGVPFIIFVGIAVFLVFYCLLKYSTFGSRVYYVGANPQASRVSGISVNRLLTTTYVISGVMAAFASLLFISRLNSAKSDIGDGFELDAIAATLIGGTSFAGGVGSIGGTAIGALIIILIRNTMNLLGISPLWQGFATGLIMVGLILCDELLRRLVGRRTGVTRVREHKEEPTNG